MNPQKLVSLLKMDILVNCVEKIKILRIHLALDSFSLELNPFNRIVPVSSLGVAIIITSSLRAYLHELDVPVGSSRNFTLWTFPPLWLHKRTHSLGVCSLFAFSFPPINLLSASWYFPYFVYFLPFFTPARLSFRHQTRGAKCGSSEQRPLCNAVDYVAYVTLFLWRG